MNSLPPPEQVADADWRMAAEQFGYPSDVTPSHIKYWDGGVKLAEVLQRARELGEHRKTATDWLPIITLEHEGPKCPYCGRQFTADEDSYFDESRYTEETCDECEQTFDVEVHTSTVWRCKTRDLLADAPPSGEPS